MNNQDIGHDLLKNVEIKIVNDDPHNKTNIRKFITVLTIDKSGVDGLPLFKIKAENKEGFKVISQKEARFLNTNFGINLVIDTGDK